jgi:hypothetical protein
MAHAGLLYPVVDDPVTANDEGGRTFDWKNHELLKSIENALSDS